LAALHMVQAAELRKRAKETGLTVLLRARHWGDSVVVTVKRGDAEVRINAELRRKLKEQR
jgi:hypothetical protein